MSIKFKFDQDVQYTGAYSVIPYNPGVEKAMTFTTRFGEEVCMSRKSGQTLQVPRGLVPIAKHDVRVSYPPVAINCKDMVPRHEEQALLPGKSLALLQEGTDHIFEAPTGWGKTIAGSWVAIKLGQPTMIVITKNDLYDSWYKALTHVFGVNPSLIGRVQQDVCNWQGKQFVIGMVHSLVIPDRYPAEMYRYFGLLILDEAHLMAADTFVETCWKFPARHRLGFSATPDRSDGKERLLWAHIGPVLVRGKMVPMKAKVLVKKTGWKIPMKKNWKTGEVEKLPHGPGRMMLVAKAMAGSQDRNSQIVEFVHAAFKAGRNVLVMSDLKEDHLNRLFQMICSAGITGDQIGFYVGGMKQTDLDIAKKKRVILATYGMCSTGTDVPEWDTLVMATPRADVKQAVGRVLRQKEGKKQPVILDLVDYDSIFSGFHHARLKQYYANGAEIVNV